MSLRLAKTNSPASPANVLTRAIRYHQNPGGGKTEEVSYPPLHLITSPIIAPYKRVSPSPQGRETPTTIPRHREKEGGRAIDRSLPTRDRGRALPLRSPTRGKAAVPPTMVSQAESRSLDVAPRLPYEGVDAPPDR